MTGIFGILESSAMQWYQDIALTQRVFFFPFFIVTSILYGPSRWVQLRLICGSKLSQASIVSKWQSLIKIQEASENLFFFMFCHVFKNSKRMFENDIDFAPFDPSSRVPRSRGVVLVPINRRERLLIWHSLPHGLLEQRVHHPHGRSSNDADEVANREGRLLSVRD